MLYFCSFQYCIMTRMRNCFDVILGEYFQNINVFICSVFNFKDICFFFIYFIVESQPLYNRAY